MNNFWYALQVKPRFEKVVETQLQYKGYEVLLPVHTSTRKWSDRTKSISLPIFPSYVFCRFDINARLPILITPGVNSVVGAGKLPIAIDDTEIQSLCQLVKSGLRPEPSPYIREGEPVRIENGPLEGLTGIVVRTSGHDRLILSVTLLQRSVAVEVDSRWIKPLNRSYAFAGAGPALSIN
jgi:transcription antitermination factor NusG